MQKRPSGSLTRFLRHLETGLKKVSVETPCGSCTACCRDPELHVDLTPEETEIFPSVEKLGRRVLPRQENGECINLIEGKCVVYANRPRSCRIYDCRYHLLGLPLSNDCTIMKEAVAQWEPFRLPTTEDKTAFVAICALVLDIAKRDPSLTGLAYMILSWKAYRPQAYDFVQGVLHDNSKPEPAPVSG